MGTDTGLVPAVERNRKELEMLKNIVFLDIDGVLNSCIYVHSVRGNGRKYNEIDETALFFLKRIVEENDAEIVLSSTSTANP